MRTALRLKLRQCLYTKGFHSISDDNQKETDTMTTPEDWLLLATTRRRALRRSVIHVGPLRRSTSPSPVAARPAGHRIWGA